MEYKRKEPLDYKDISDNLRNPAWYDLENSTNLLDDAATAINDLLVSNMGLRVEAKAFKTRAEKAEKERDEALDLIGWIYYEACVSVEHDMRQYLDWLKDKIDEWKKNKE